ncbi:MAG: hypothetical protein M3N91_10475 [Pseudomonadota bacterium]|nr:hypothetical protein [Pseudomonadota bacterium]
MRSFAWWVSLVGAPGAGPVNSASIEKSIKSPTPIVVPWAGKPNAMPVLRRGVKLLAEVVGHRARG